MTQRTRAVEALDALPAGVAVADPQLRVVEVNQELAELTGRASEDLIGQPLDALLAPASRVMLHNYLLPLLQLHGRVEEFAATLDARGRERPDVLLNAHWTVDRGSDGAPALPREAARRPDRRLRLVVVRHRARRQVEDDLLRIQRAADQSPGVMFQLLEHPGQSVHFPFASEGLRPLYRVSPDQARRNGRAVMRRIHPQDLRVLKARTAQNRLLGSTDLHVGVRVRQGPGQWRLHEVQASGRALENGQWIWHGYAADVTERHELQRAIQQRNAAEEARLQQLGFLSRLSHELRTPLNAILGFAQVMQRRLDPGVGAEQREPVEMIGRAGRQLLRMVDDVLEVSRLQTGDFSIELQAVDVDALVRETLGMQAPIAEAAGVKLIGPPAAAATWVRADPHRLRQVLTNLVSNGIKFNLPGGTVRIELSARPTEQVVVVADDGPGLSEAQQRQLFQPFNRLGAERSGIGGTGLGLVISRHLAEAMGGRIEVSSEPGHGARFSVGLPLAEASGTDLAVGDPRACAPELPARILGGAARLPPASGEVLYVEDDRVNALLMAAVLGSRPGVRLRMATTAAEALKAAADHPPRLLLLDRHLPDGDGMELLLHLRALPGMAQVPAVMVSAAALPEDLEHARNVGFDGYWSKPLDVPATLADLDRRLAPT